MIVLKKISVLIICFALVFSFCGCKDKGFSGTVTAEAASPLYGWVDYLVVEYENGEVVSAEYDAYDFEYTKKSECDDTYGMAYRPSEWMPLIAQSVVDAGSSDNMEIVSGATRSSKQCQKLFAAIEEAVKNGDTEDIILVEY